jgi:hypothetical protein
MLISFSIHLNTLPAARDEAWTLKQVQGDANLTPHPPGRSHGHRAPDIDFISTPLPSPFQNGSVIATQATITTSDTDK